MHLPPPPRPRMVITGGYCPEHWRWTVRRVSTTAIVLADGPKEVRLHLDQWLPFLAARCRMDAVHIDGRPIAAPAAEPLWLAGETPSNEATPPKRPPLEAADLATRVRQARALWTTATFAPEAQQKGEGPCVQVRMAGALGGPRVCYDLDKGHIYCTCAEWRHVDISELCAHGLAVLMRDPKAATLLLRALTTVPPQRAV